MIAARPVPAGGLAVDYYHPPGYVPAQGTLPLAVAEEKLRLLQDEERRSRARSKLLEEQLNGKQEAIKTLAMQQDERRSMLQTLDAEIERKQQLLGRLAAETGDRTAKLQPLEEQIAAKRQALGASDAQLDEMRQQVKKLEEEVAARQRAVVGLGDHSAGAAEKQRSVQGLVEQQRKLEADLGQLRQQAGEHAARAASAEASAELFTVQGDRQQVQLRMLEKEAQEKRDTLDKIKAQLEDTQAQFKDAQDKGLLLERELARQRLEVQLAEEEATMRRSMLQDLAGQQGQLEAEVDRLRRAQRERQATDLLLREQSELQEHLRGVQQELARAKLSLEDKVYKTQAMETLMQAQRPRLEGAPALNASCALTTTAIVAAATPHQQLLTLLRRQEDRILRLQQDLADQESRVRKSETHAFQEQELRDMVENEVRVALAELDLEKGRAQALQRGFELQDARISSMHQELERGRKHLLTMEPAKQTGPENDAPVGVQRAASLPTFEEPTKSSVDEVIETDATSLTQANASPEPAKSDPIYVSKGTSGFQSVEGMPGALSENAS